MTEGYFLALKATDLRDSTDNVVIHAYYEDPNNAGKFIEAYYVLDNARENAGSTDHIVLIRMKYDAGSGYVSITKLKLEAFSPGATTPYLEREFTVAWTT